MRLAYEALDADTKALLETHNLHAWHSTTFSQTNDIGFLPGGAPTKEENVFASAVPQL